MRPRWIHSTCRTACLAAGLCAALVSWTGCSFFDKDRLNLNRYRDERAVDVDKRLSEQTPIVKNPF